MGVEVGGRLYATASLHPQYPLHTRLGRAPEPSERYGLNKNLLSPPRIDPRFFSRTACHLVPIPASSSNATTSTKNIMRVVRLKQDYNIIFFLLALQPQFGPWPTLHETLRFTSVY
jgi:hypothetical protein